MFGTNAGLWNDYRQARNADNFGTSVEGALLYSAVQTGGDLANEKILEKIAQQAGEIAEETRISMELSRRLDEFDAWEKGEIRKGYFSLGKVIGDVVSVLDQFTDLDIQNLDDLKGAPKQLVDNAMARADNELQQQQKALAGQFQQLTEDYKSLMDSEMNFKEQVQGRLDEFESEFKTYKDEFAELPKDFKTKISINFKNLEHVDDFNDLKIDDLTKSIRVDTDIFTDAGQIGKKAFGKIMSPYEAWKYRKIQYEKMFERLRSIEMYINLYKQSKQRIKSAPIDSKLDAFLKDWDAEDMVEQIKKALEETQVYEED